MIRNARSATAQTQERVRYSAKGSGSKADLPRWVKPQLSELVKQPPDGSDWLHEIKFNGYRIHARIEHGEIRLLTRTGLDWTHKYPPVAAALKKLAIGNAYIDGELCGVRLDGTTSFGMIQAASESGNADALVFFVFDLLFLEGEDLTGLPLVERKARLATVMSGVGPPLQYSEHQVGRGPTFYAEACKLGLEGIVSKRADAPYVPGDRCLWVKTKCVNREEFVVVGWTDPEAARPKLGALLLAYYDDQAKLIYAGRAGAGISDAELEKLWRRLQPLGIDKMPLDVPPPRTSRFGSPLVLSRVHWVRPEFVAEVKFLTWTEEGLLRQVIYQGLRENKPATDVRRSPPHGVFASSARSRCAKKKTGHSCAAPRCAEGEHPSASTRCGRSNPRRVGYLLALGCRCCASNTSGGDR